MAGHTLCFSVQGAHLKTDILAIVKQHATGISVSSSSYVLLKHDHKAHPIRQSRGQSVGLMKKQVRLPEAATETDINRRHDKGSNHGVGREY